MKIKTRNSIYTIKDEGIYRNNEPEPLFTKDKIASIENTGVGGRLIVTYENSEGCLRSMVTSTIQEIE